MEIGPGINLEQMVVTVPNTDVDINAEIDAAAGELWAVSSLTLFNSDASVIILFSRTTAAS